MNELEAHNVQSFGSASSFCGPKCLEVYCRLYFPQQFCCLYFKTFADLLELFIYLLSNLIYKCVSFGLS